MLAQEPLEPLRVPLRRIAKYYKRASDGIIAETIEAVEATFELVVEGDELMRSGDVFALQGYGRTVFRNRLRDALKHLFEVIDVLEDRPHNKGRDDALRSCYNLTQRVAEHLGQTVQQLQALSV